MYRQQMRPHHWIAFLLHQSLRSEPRRMVHFLTTEGLHPLFLPIRLQEEKFRLRSLHLCSRVRKQTVWPKKSLSLLFASYQHEDKRHDSYVIRTRQKSKTNCRLSLMLTQWDEKRLWNWVSEDETVFNIYKNTRYMRKKVTGRKMWWSGNGMREKAVKLEEQFLLLWIRRPHSLFSSSTDWLTLTRPVTFISFFLIRRETVIAIYFTFFALSLLSDSSSDDGEDCFTVLQLHHLG